MADIDEVLEDYQFAETITRAIGNGKLNVTVAEMHPHRNRDFNNRLADVIARVGKDEISKIGEDEEIDLVCATVLKGWDATRGGKPIPIEDAAALFKGSTAGRILFRELKTVASQPASFKGEASKKKTSSSSTPRRSPSARSRPRSKSRTKSAGSASRKGSATT